jgi:uncharacterized protein (DUF3084 family)
VISAIIFGAPALAQEVGEIDQRFQTARLLRQHAAEEVLGRAGMADGGRGVAQSEQHARIVRLRAARAREAAMASVCRPSPERRGRPA